MDDDALDLLKQTLDDDLKSLPKNTGIKFGVDAFREFVRRGWIADRTFTFQGIPGAFPILLPAYGQNYAGCDPFIEGEAIELPKAK